VYAVIGVWDMDPERAGLQREVLDKIVLGVRQAPGIVKGYWTDGPESNRSHTFIVFDDQASAESFAADVRGNVTNQDGSGVRNVSLEVTNVVATT
jgi:hypothetical protein